MKSLIVQTINQFDLSNSVNDQGSQAGASGTFWLPNMGLLGIGKDQFYHGGMFGTSNYDANPEPNRPVVRISNA